MIKQLQKEYGSFRKMCAVCIYQIICVLLLYSLTNTAYPGTIIYNVVFVNDIIDIATVHK